MVSQPRVTNYDFVFGLQLKRKAAAVVVDRLDYLAADLDVCMTVCTVSAVLTRVSIVLEHLYIFTVTPNREKFPKKVGFSGNFNE